MLATLLEIQSQRALMAKFEEDLMSQGASSEASAELERFFRLAESAKRISEDRQTLTVVATATGSGEGPLSSLFGSRVGELSQGLRNPIQSEDIIDAAEIIDAPLGDS
jgi:reverse gyrase